MHTPAIVLAEWLSRFDLDGLVEDVLWKLQNLGTTDFLTAGGVLVLVLAFTVRRAVGMR